MDTAWRTAAAAVRDHLAERLDPAAMRVSRQQQQLVEAAVELLTGETIRYFEYLLDEHSLPAVPDKITGTTRRGRPHRRTSPAAVRAVQPGVTIRAGRTPQAPRANMTVHGVNRFESNAQ